MHYVYVLRLLNGDLYKGSTSNLRERIRQHKTNQVESTKFKEPNLIHYECYMLASDATRRERFLKTTEGRRLLKQQLRDILNQPNELPSSLT
jgi:putative endonuclease